MVIGCQGRVAEAFQWVDQTIEAAQANDDLDMLVAGHTLACAWCFYTGRPRECLQHREKVAALYSETHRHLVTLLNNDPKTITGTKSAICLWMLGYPERAVR